MKTSFKAYLFIISLILYFIIPAVIVMTLVDHAQWYLLYLLDTHVDVCELLVPYMQNQN